VTISKAVGLRVLGVDSRRQVVADERRIRHLPPEFPRFGACEGVVRRAG
jgi:hypothetical protein